MLVCPHTGYKYNSPGGQGHQFAQSPPDPHALNESCMSQTVNRNGEQTFINITCSDFIYED